MRLFGSLPLGRDNFSFSNFKYFSQQKQFKSYTHMLYASLEHISDFFFQIGEDRSIRNLKGSFFLSVPEKHSFLEVNKKVLYVPNTHTAASNITK